MARKIAVSYWNLEKFFSSNFGAENQGNPGVCVCVNERWNTKLYTKDRFEIVCFLKKYIYGKDCAYFLKFKWVTGFIPRFSHFCDVLILFLALPRQLMLPWSISYCCVHVNRSMLCQRELAFPNLLDLFILSCI